MTDENTAYLITGTIRAGAGSEVLDILGILFSPDPPNMKTLKAMRIEGRNTSIDPVKCIGARPADPCFYYFERCPNVKSIKVAKVYPNGSLGETKEVAGDQLQVLPSMTASAAVLARLNLPRDLEIRPSSPPAEPREMGERRSSNPGKPARQSHPPRQGCRR